MAAAGWLGPGKKQNDVVDRCTRLGCRFVLERERLGSALDNGDNGRSGVKSPRGVRDTVTPTCHHAVATRQANGARGGRVARVASCQLELGPTFTAQVRSRDHEKNDTEMRRSDDAHAATEQGGNKDEDEDGEAGNTSALRALSSPTHRRHQNNPDGSTARLIRNRAW